MNEIHCYIRSENHFKAPVTKGLKGIFFFLDNIFDNYQYRKLKIAKPTIGKSKRKTRAYVASDLQEFRDY